METSQMCTLQTKREKVWISVLSLTKPCETMIKEMVKMCWCWTRLFHSEEPEPSRINRTYFCTLEGCWTACGFSPTYRLQCSGAKCVKETGLAEPWVCPLILGRAGGLAHSDDLSSRTVSLKAAWPQANSLSDTHSSHFYSKRTGQHDVYGTF